MSQLVVLFDKARTVSPADLWRLKFVVEEAGQHRANAWGFPAPAVMTGHDERKLPDGAMALVFVTDKRTNPGALADHYWDPTRASGGAPAGTVYYDRGTGMRTGPNSASEGTTHELEALNNPRLDRWILHPDKRRAAMGHELACEDSDATQDSYDIELPDPVTGDPVTWPVANFVLPAWFEPDDGSGRPVDYAGRLSHPGQIGPEGYAVFRGPREGGGREYWLEFGDGSRSGSLPSGGRAGAKSHAPIAGRTQRLLAGG